MSDHAPTTPGANGAAQDTSAAAREPLDVAAIRQDFPILQRRVHDKPLVYLDNAATSQKPRQVIQALVDYYEQTNANIHRGLHTLAEEATTAYEDARAKVAKFIGASGPDEILFTRNTTEALNLVAYTWAADNIGPGDEIVISTMEHHSNIVPWQWVANRQGAVLKYAEVDADGKLSLDEIAKLVTDRTKLVSMMHVSSVLGTINPIGEIARIAHEHGALMLADGAQSAPHLPVNVADLACDFFAFSSHKMMGPTGVGVLWGRRAILQEMRPFLGGGEMIEIVERQSTTYNELPWKYEAGTPNIADVIAFGAAIDYLSHLGMDRVRAHEIELTAYALERIGKIPGVTIYGPKTAEERGGVVAFTVDGVHPHDLGQIVDYEGVAIRAGQHCCQVLATSIGVPATARASFYVYNTPEEVDALVKAVESARDIFSTEVSSIVAR
jgi:cysteine desulfurase/selenocysteine lyase